MHVFNYFHFSQVLKSIIDLLPSTKVQGFVVDFESGMWQALKSVFPTKSIQGCVFHWSKAVWRKAQELGLQVFM